jgi:hypothetical protein
VGPSTSQRIERSWRQCKHWITQFDGSPTIAMLVEVQADSILPALQILSKSTDKFRLTRIGAGRRDSADFINLIDFADELSLLQQAETAELNVNFGYRSPNFDLDIHMIIHPLDADRVSLELVWWSDQVFSIESDNTMQFQSLAGYLIELQQLFDASQLFIAPESGLAPHTDEGMWTEI